MFLVDEFLRQWPGKWEVLDEGGHPYMKKNTNDPQENKRQHETRIKQKPIYFGEEKKWFSVSGDVDDFIFYDPCEKQVSER